MNTGNRKKEKNPLCEGINQEKPNLELLISKIIIVAAKIKHKKKPH
jgi:hypothetical protein